MNEGYHVHAYYLLNVFGDNLLSFLKDFNLYSHVKKIKR